MQLKIDGERRQLAPIQPFRAQHKLPQEFGVNYFEPKDWTDLGTIDGAGPQMAWLNEQVMGAAPALLAAPDLPTAVEELRLTFHRALLGINQTVGLRPPEIDFAVSGFHAVLQAAADQMVQLVYTPGPNIAQRFDFEEVYQNWLDDSARVSATEHHYSHRAEAWRVSVVNYVYGRAGLVIATPTTTHYLQDLSLACPAAGFMQDLCRDVSQALWSALDAD